jgi:hypothetical protein
MAGFGLLGQLAGGYAQAAELENRRKFEADQQQRQAALGMTKILLESPNVPPEYKASLVQYGMDVIHTPHGKKIPDFQKQVMSQVPALQTPGQSQSVAQPSLQLGGPSAPPAPAPSNPAALGGGGPAASGSAPSLASSGSAANGGAPGAMLPPVGPPPPAPSPMSFGPGSAQFSLPGSQSQVSLAPQQIAPAGQFHMLSPQEIAQQQAQSANAALQTQIQGLKQQGFSDEQIALKMGMSKFMPIPFGGLYNVGTGDTVSPTNTPKTKVQYTVPGDPTPKFGFFSRAGGPISDAASGQEVLNATPFTPSMMGTTSDTSSTYNPDTGTTSTHKVTKKVGGTPAASAGSGSAPPSPMTTHVGSTPKSITSGTPGGRISSMAQAWSEYGQKPTAKDLPYVEKYMAANNLTPMPPMPAGDRSKLTVAFQGIGDAQSRYNRMADDIAQIDKHPDNVGSFDMDLLSQHIALTFGTAKNVRGGQQLIEHHLQARSLPEDMVVMYEKLKNGGRLSPAQRQNFLHLAQTTLTNKQREYGELKDNLRERFGTQAGPGGPGQPPKPQGQGGKRSAQDEADEYLKSLGVH